MILTIRKYSYLRGTNKVTQVYYKEKIDFKNIKATPSFLLWPNHTFGNYKKIIQIGGKDCIPEWANTAIL